MLRLLAARRSAMTRRTPTMGISSTSASSGFTLRTAPAVVPRPCAVPVLVSPDGLAPASQASTSACRVRPRGPLGGTWARSMPASAARRRTAGEATTLGCRRAGDDAVAGSGCTSARRSGRCIGVSAGGGVAAGTILSLDAGTVAAATSTGPGCVAGTRSATATASNAMSSAPTATLSPGSPWMRNTVPPTGAGTSTLALSVMMSATMSSSATTSPGRTCHAMISASTAPSPKSGSLNTNSLMAPPQAASSTFSMAAATRRGPGK